MVAQPTQPLSPRTPFGTVSGNTVYLERNAFQWLVQVRENTDYGGTTADQALEDAEAAQAVAADALAVAEIAQTNASAALVVASAAQADADAALLAANNAQADIDAHEALTSAHGATGAVVGTTNTQTLTGKSFGDIPILTGGGIKFPATQVPSADANTLDDYEEGTWTPAITFGGGSTGLTYSTQVGRYRKIGDFIFAWCRIVVTAKGSSTGAALITGLPVAAASGLVGVAGMSLASNFTGLTGALSGFVAASASAIQLRQSSATGNPAITDTSFTNTTDLAFWAAYNV